MRLEAGKYNPSLKLAIDISKIVDTPIDELFILISFALLKMCFKYKLKFSFESLLTEGFLFFK